MDKFFDEIDRKIINAYLQDSRLSYREIAKRLGIAVGTVMTRTKKLELQGIIESYSAILNHNKLGYELTVITEIKVSKGKLVEMEKEIAKICRKSVKILEVGFLPNLIIVSGVILILSKIKL